MPTIPIALDLRNPRMATLGGNAWWTVHALSNIDLGYWEFLKDVDGKVYGVSEPFPATLAGTPAAKIVLITGYGTATTGVARWNVMTKCLAQDAESWDVTLTNDTAQDITVPGTARLGKKITFSAGDLGNIAAGDVVVLDILHEGSHANDTVAQNSELFQAFMLVDVP